MINKINIEKFIEYNNKLNNNKDSFELPNEVKGHIDWVAIEMVSEDGTDFLQGIGLAEVYKTAKGYCAKIIDISVAAECRNIGFGSVILDHLAINANISIEEGECVKVFIAKIGAKNENKDYIKSMFESCGYETNETLRQISFSKEINV